MAGDDGTDVYTLKLGNRRFAGLGRHVAMLEWNESDDPASEACTVTITTVGDRQFNFEFSVRSLGAEFHDHILATMRRARR